MIFFRSKVTQQTVKMMGGWVDGWVGTQEIVVHWKNVEFVRSTKHAFAQLQQIKLGVFTTRLKKEINSKNTDHFKE